MAAAVLQSPRPTGGRSRSNAQSSDRERLLLRAVDEVEVRCEMLTSPLD